MKRTVFWKRMTALALAAILLLGLLPAAAFLLAALVSIWLLYRCKRYMNELG